MPDAGAEEPLAGPAAPPMVNGEVVFEAPWQRRVFGMARALAADGLYDWDEFRVRLIARIGAWDRADTSADRDYRYYDHFLGALEDLLVAKEVVAPGSLEARVKTLASRPHGHDH